MQILTERDDRIIELIAQFGQTYLSVVDQMLFDSPQYARNRVMDHLHKKFGLLQLNRTGIVSPRTYLTLSDSGKQYAKNVLNLKEEDFKNANFSLAEFERDYFSQIVFLAMKVKGFEVELASGSADFIIAPVNVPVFIELSSSIDENKYMDNDINEAVYAVMDRLTAINLSGVLSHIKDNQFSIIVIEEILEGTLTFYTINQLNKEVNKK